MTIEQMKKRKQELGYSAEYLAEKAGLPVSTVRKIFSGVTKAPRRETIEKLENILKKKQGQYTSEDYHARPDGFWVELVDGTFYGVTSGRPLPQKLVDAMLVKETPFVYGDLAGVDFEDENAPEQSQINRNPYKKYYTPEDYLAMPEDWRGELIDGELVALSQPTHKHQEIILEIAFQIRQFIKNTDHPCRLLLSPELHLTEESREYYVPDLVILCDKRKDRENMIVGAPDMTVEVLSPTTRKYDFGAKHRDYRNYGVREYWIIDGDERKVIRCWFEKGEEQTYGFDEKIPVCISGGDLKIDLSEL